MVISFLISIVPHEQPSYCTGMGSSPLVRNFHEEHNDAYCDLPSTFIFDEFAFKSHS